MSSPRRSRSRSSREPVNVRGSLVGEESAEQLGIEGDKRTALATMGLGALMLVLSVAVLAQASQLPEATSTVGPATLPWVVGALLLVVGALTLRAGRRDMGVWESSEHVTGQDWMRMLVLLGVLVVFAVVLPYLGYVVASTLLFGTTAIVLGAPYRARAFAYGWCLASIVYLVFDIGIGLSLPAGPWGF